MRTRLTEILAIEHPVLSAGIPVIGVDLVVPFCDAAHIDACIDAGVAVLSTAWGPPDDAAKRAQAAGIPHIHMVTTAAEGAAAARAGVSVIIAQGHEAGGGLVGQVGGMVLTPAVVDAVAMSGASPRPPVVAGGGVADGRGLAAALALGAEGEVELGALPERERAALAERWAQARAEGRMQETEYIAGQDAGLIHDIVPAADIIRRIVDEATVIMRRAARDAEGAS
jgi:NAD(P)H-dependent flavin oxidoreductase YrpB (nitropropane dioxygenase family)